MGVGGINASNQQMMQMMQILMEGMQRSTDLATQMVAVSVENTIISDKMATAQQIIDVYA